MKDSKFIEHNLRLQVQLFVKKYIHRQCKKQALYKMYN